MHPFCVHSCECKLYSFIWVSCVLCNQAGNWCLFWREFEKLSEDLQSAETEISWLTKAAKPIYSSSVQGLLRTKIEAGEDDVTRVFFRLFV